MAPVHSNDLNSIYSKSHRSFHFAGCLSGVNPILRVAPSLYELLRLIPTSTSIKERFNNRKIETNVIFQPLIRFEKFNIRQSKNTYLKRRCKKLFQKN